MKRAIIIVLDSAGIGALPDAAEYGDVDANTLVNIKRTVPEMDLKNLNALGLSCIDGCGSLSDVPVINPTGSFGRLASQSKGKDTTVGHWEIAGLCLDSPLPVYPNGFHPEIISEFENRIGRGTLGNYPASGTEIIKTLGGEHVRTGRPIVYTSADSVFQIAMHEDVIPLAEQYEISRIARELLVFPDNVSRVITRPFVGAEGAYIRTKNRRDFSLEPMGLTMLDYIKQAGLDVVAIGKIEDIFAGRGITKSIHTLNNNDGVDKTIDCLKTVEGGLIFVNLVDFDMLYGHRNDPAGYAGALAEFDGMLPGILETLRSDDVLFITADHGCDPTVPGTDHTRESVPLLTYGDKIKAGINLGTRAAFADIGASVLDWLGVESEVHGTSFMDLISIDCGSSPQ